MKIDEILESMERVLDHAKPLPFATHKVIIDGDRLRELINDMRMNVPAEVKRAKLIEFDCDRILQDASMKAEAIVQEAEQKAQQLIDRQTISMEAKERAMDMMNKAKAASDDIKKASENYVLHVLSEVEQYFSSGLTEIQETKNQIQNRRKK